jgi:phosphatidylethanolamine-binding protein (PEBP) family uncharacterized protein
MNPININKPRNYSEYLYVLFENYNIKDGVHMQLSNVQNEPKIHYSEIFPNNHKISNIFYTFIIVDPDAPAGFMIHQCIYNIPGDKIQKGKILYPYHPPSPPKGSGEHRYFCILYEQSAIITKPPVVNKEKRAYKKFADFTKKKLGINITPIASKFFICHYEGGR